MKRFSSLQSMLIVGCIFVHAQAVAKPTDSEIRRELIGSWIVPLDSPDRTPETDSVMETFRLDGTYVAYYFQDSTCRVITRQVEVKWLVENGVLISIYPNGTADHDDVVSIGGGVMTLHSHEDGATYTRAKANSCARPSA